MKALISVYEKEKIIEFAKGLNELGIEIIATDGTAKKILEAGIEIPVTNVSKLTGFEEMLSGKIKTLHPAIHAAIMTSEIEIVAVNLIPVDDEDSKEKPSLDKMDVGGVALIKSGIKSFGDVAVIVNPKRYKVVLKELKEGKISDITRLKLAIEASDYIVWYESKVNEVIKTFSESFGY